MTNSSFSFKAKQSKDLGVGDSRQLKVTEHFCKVHDVEQVDCTQYWQAEEWIAYEGRKRGSMTATLLHFRRFNEFQKWANENDHIGAYWMWSVLSLTCLFPVPYVLFKCAQCLGSFFQSDFKVLRTGFSQFNMREEDIFCLIFTHTPGGRHLQPLPFLQVKISVCLFSFITEYTDLEG